MSEYLILVVMLEKNVCTLPIFYVDLSELTHEAQQTKTLAKLLAKKRSFAIDFGGILTKEREV